MADQLIVTDEPYDQQMVVLVSVDGVRLLTNVLMAPENFTDYTGTKTYGGAG